MRYVQVYCFAEYFIITVNVGVISDPLTVSTIAPSFYLSSVIVGPMYIERAIKNSHDLENANAFLRF